MVSNLIDKNNHITIIIFPKTHKYKAREII